jgi:hypothetical protein
MPMPFLASLRGVRGIAALLLLGCALSGCASDQTTAARTALASRDGIVIYAAGDVADCRSLSPSQSGAAYTAALIARDPEAPVLMLGDGTYPVGRPEEFTECYEPTWGRFKARTFPAPGNHEYYTPGAIGYYRYFGERAGPGNRGYYSFDLGSWHVVSINSNLKPAQQEIQLAWLKTDLAQHKAQCTLAFWHHPLFSSGGHGNNEKMRQVWQVLEDAGAELVLSGHDHDYERFAPQDADGKRDDVRGMRQFVVGTGGARLTPMRFGKPNSERSSNGTHGVLKLWLKDGGYEWEFMPVTEGVVSDRGAALCH